jgi:adenine-specific DNA-methyltransferase
MQVGRGATDRSKAKIFSEEYHLAELERRLAEEESAFAERRRGVKEPIHKSSENILP